MATETLNEQTTEKPGGLPAELKRLVMLPCAYCGGSGFVQECDDGTLRGWASCDDCGADGPMVDWKTATQENVIEKWNSRQYRAVFIEYIAASEALHNSPFDMAVIRKYGEAKGRATTMLCVDEKLEDLVA